MIALDLPTGVVHHACCPGCGERFVPENDDMEMLVHPAGKACDYPNLDIDWRADS